MKKSFKRCVAIIPARGGSKSIPKKNIMDFCGKPLIAWTIEQALGSKYVNEVYVTTDDKNIGTISSEYGAKVVWRPPHLAIDTSSSEEALLHAIDEIEKHKKIDIVIFLQATSPVRKIEDIDEAVEKFFHEKADSLLSVAKLEDFCAWKMSGNKPESITYDYKNRGRRQARPKHYLENGSIYIFRPASIKRYNNRLSGKIIFYEMPLWRSFEINSIEDAKICEYFMGEILNAQSVIDAKDIQLIVYDFDGVMTDNKALTLDDGREAVVVNRGDGLAINRIKKQGIPQLIISTESNEVVIARGKKLGIPVLSNIADKKKCLIEYCKKNKYGLKKIVYIGNDINDLAVMKSVGIAVCPKDAHSAVKGISKYILNKKGGDGAIREFADLVLTRTTQTEA